MLGLGHEVFGRGNDEGDLHGSGEERAAADESMFAEEVASVGGEDGPGLMGVGALAGGLGEAADAVVDEADAGEVIGAEAAEGVGLEALEEDAGVAGFGEGVECFEIGGNEGIVEVFGFDDAVVEGGRRQVIARAGEDDEQGPGFVGGHLLQGADGLHGDEAIDVFVGVEHESFGFERAGAEALTALDDNGGGDAFVADVFEVGAVGGVEQGEVFGEDGLVEQGCDGADGTDAGEVVARVAEPEGQALEDMKVARLGVGDEAMLAGVQGGEEAGETAAVGGAGGVGDEAQAPGGEGFEFGGGQGPGAFIADGVAAEAAGEDNEQVSAGEHL